MNVKKCTICGVSKPLTEFPREKRMKDGYKNQCKACRIVQRRERRINRLGSNKGVDFIVCQECGDQFKVLTNTHLHGHNLTMEQYKLKYPNSLVCSENTSEKMSEISKNYFKDPTAREKVSKRFKQLWQDPLYQIKHSEALNDPEVRAKLSKKRKELWKNPEYRENQVKKATEHWTPEKKQTQSETLKKYFRDPEAKAKHIKAMNTPECKAKHSKISKELWESAEYREKMDKILKERWQDPNFKEKRSKQFKELWKDTKFREKMIKTMNSPECRAKNKERWKDPIYREKMARCGNGSGKAGYRSDLGHSVRSIWEANVCRILNYEGIVYLFEPQRFDLGEYRYVPDFYLPDMDLWLEVKGYVRKDTLEKVKYQIREFSKSHVLLLVDKKLYKQLEVDYKEVIPNWETSKNTNVVRMKNPLQQGGVIA